MTRWLEHGGDAVLESYGSDPFVIPEADIAWLEALPLMRDRWPDVGYQNGLRSRR